MPNSVSGVMNTLIMFSNQIARHPTSDLENTTIPALPIYPVSTRHVST